MDQEAINSRRAHLPEAASSTPATDDPAAASKTADAGGQERRRRRGDGIGDGERRNARTSRWAGFRGRKGEGVGRRDLRMMRGLGEEEGGRK